MNQTQQKVFETRWSVCLSWPELQTSTSEPEGATPHRSSKEMPCWNTEEATLRSCTYVCPRRLPNPSSTKHSCRWHQDINLETTKQITFDSFIYFLINNPTIVTKAVANYKYLSMLLALILANMIFFFPS